MTRDYAKKTSNRNKNKRRTEKSRHASNWVWLFTGVVLGALLSTLIKLAEINPEQTQAKPKQTPTKGATTPEPRFDFYTLLRETEVIVPENETPVVVKTPSKQDAAVFLLQVGSFKNAADADSLRAKLLLLNLQASTEQVNPRPGETWHRVLVGPFESSSALSSARVKLAENKIESLLLKRKQ